MAKKTRTFAEWFAGQIKCATQGDKYRGLSFDRAYALLMKDTNFIADADWIFRRLRLTLLCTCNTEVKCYYDMTPGELRRHYPKKLFRAALRKVGVRVPAPRKKATSKTTKPGAKRQRSDGR